MTLSAENRKRLKAVDPKKLTIEDVDKMRESEDWGVYPMKNPYDPEGGSILISFSNFLTGQEFQLIAVSDDEYSALTE